MNQFVFGEVCFSLTQFLHGEALIGDNKIVVSPSLRKISSIGIDLDETVHCHPYCQLQLGLEIQVTINSVDYAKKTFYTTRPLVVRVKSSRCIDPSAKARVGKVK